MRCQYCGKEIPDDAPFCAECGANLGAVKEGKCPDITMKIDLPPEAVKPKPADAASRTEKAEKAAESFDPLADFAPQPLVIPDQDPDKARAKAEKEALREEKLARPERLPMKILRGVITAILVVAITAVAAATLTVLTVRQNTTRASISACVERLTVWELPLGLPNNLAQALHWTPSAEGATLVDVVRDQATVPVTNRAICEMFEASTMNDFVTDQLYAYARLLLRGGNALDLTGESVTAMLRENDALFRRTAGIYLSDADYRAIASYLQNTETSIVHRYAPARLAQQGVWRYIQFFSIFFTDYLVVAVVVLLLLLLLLVWAVNKRFRSSLLWGGISFVIAALAFLAIGVLGLMFGAAPLGGTVAEQTFQMVFLNNASTSVLCNGAITLVIGCFFLVMHALIHRRSAK